MKCVGAEDGHQPCQRCKRSNTECVFFALLFPQYLLYFLTTALGRCVFEKHRRGRKPGSKSVPSPPNHLYSLSHPTPTGSQRPPRCSDVSRKASAMPSAYLRLSTLRSPTATRISPPSAKIMSGPSCYTLHGGWLYAHLSQASIHKRLRRAFIHCAALWLKLHGRR